MFFFLKSKFYFEYILLCSPTSSPDKVSQFFFSPLLSTPRATSRIACTSLIVPGKLLLAGGVVGWLLLFPVQYLFTGHNGKNEGFFLFFKYLSFFLNCSVKFCLFFPSSSFFLSRQPKPFMIFFFCSFFFLPLFLRDEAAAKVDFFLFSFSFFLFSSSFISIHFHSVCPGQKID